MATASSAHLPKERHMGQRLYATIDHNFEESSFAEAIRALDEACSPNHAPHDQHVRQLLYVAMYPHGNIKEKNIIDVPTSPTKLGKNKINHQKANQPTPADSAAALRVLNKFTAVNNPGNVLHGIASYASQKPEISKMDSNIASLSLKFVYCKDCWSILKPGFAQITEEDARLVASPTRKKRPITREYSQASHVTLADSGPLVDDNAWPILDWLLYTFEKDEALTRDSTGVSFSPLLLDQIPFPRDAASETERKDVGIPLDVAFFALAQQQVEHKRLGARLLTLLCNLSSTIYVDPEVLARSVRWRLTFEQGSTEPIDFAAAFAVMPLTAPVLLIKVLVCRWYINAQTGIDDSQKKPQPRPRTALKPRQSASSLPSQQNIEPLNARIARRLPILPSSEIYRLVESYSQHPNPTTTLSNVICLMIITYDSLQNKLGKDDKDGEWSSVKTRIQPIFEGSPPSGDASVLMNFSLCVQLLKGVDS